MADDKEGGWSPRETGTTEDNQVVTFRTGEGENEGQTLIGGGQQTGSQFGRAHDHYGPDQSKASDYGNLDNAPDAGDYTGEDYQPGPNKQ